MLKFVALICSLLALSHELVLKTPDEDLKSFYNVENVDNLEEFPIIIRYNGNKNQEILEYKLIRANDNADFERGEGKNYLFIKSKKGSEDVVPYGLIHRLDKIKYMILWLNLYCEMHPDCDKSVLDVELRKLVTAVGDSKGKLIF